LLQAADIGRRGMIFRAFDELIWALPAVFWSQLSPAEAAELLARESKSGALLEERVVARVDGSDVVLQRRRPFNRNPFAPILVGSLRTAKDGTQLVGEFRRRKIVLLLAGLSYFILLPGIPFALVAIPFMAMWLGASVLWGVVAGAFLALVLVGILFALAAVIRLGTYAAKLDANLIAKHVDKVFRGALSKARELE
jgi:hypothetical protein